jgi:predicted enzyme related to lactoylglutathione lyase
MSERTGYTAGTPCWVELSGTPDIEASAAFYGELLGWELPELPSSAELGGYRRAKKGGKDVAGVSPRMEDGQPTVWATYVSVVDATATLAKVGEAGGQVIVEPMDVQGLGTMAVFTDPTVFGWGYDDEPSPRVGTYTIWKVGDAMVGGMLDLNALGMPAEIPANWLVYFTVEDADAAVAKVESGGGSVMNGPIDIPVGRFAVVSDQFGATFAVMQPSEETLASAP